MPTRTTTAVMGKDTGRSAVVDDFLSVGAGSLMFSHVNDGGFWLVKEYLGMSVTQTMKTWSVCETIISVVALVFALAASLVI